MTPLTKVLVAASFVAGNPVQGATEINYWLWDSNQLCFSEISALRFWRGKVDEAKVPGGTFFLPISEHSSDVVRILRANFDSIFLNGEDPASKLAASNQEINSLFR